MARFGQIGQQYFDDAGNPLVSGKLYFYESGTSTPKTTYADVNLSVPNANPVLLTAAGRRPNIFFNGAARVVLTDNSDVQIEVSDPEGGDDITGNFATWNSLTIYNTPDIVIGSDDQFYTSITNGNQGNDPTTDLVNWTNIRFIRVWNTNETYSKGMIVEQGNFIYTSLTNNNQGNNPAGDATNWTSAVKVVIPNRIEAATAFYSQDNFGAF